MLVDDYDLVAAGPANPLQPLLEYLPQARDVGLHLVLTRRTGGAGRALYEPVIQRLRELSSPGPGDVRRPDEGALSGRSDPTPLPPGRGRLVTRREGVRLVQLAHLPPTEPLTGSRRSPWSYDSASTDPRDAARTRSNLPPSTVRRENGHAVQ